MISFVFLLSRPYNLLFLIDHFYIGRWGDHLRKPYPTICIFTGQTETGVTWNEQLPCTRVTAFLRTSLLLARFWREAKPTDAKFSFLISHTSNAFVNVVEIPFLPTKVP